MVSSLASLALSLQFSALLSRRLAEFASGLVEGADEPDLLCEVETGRRGRSTSNAGLLPDLPLALTAVSGVVALVGTVSATPYWLRAPRSFGLSNCRTPRCLLGSPRARLLWRLGRPALFLALMCYEFKISSNSERISFTSARSLGSLLGALGWDLLAWAIYRKWWSGRESNPRRLA